MQKYFTFSVRIKYWPCSSERTRGWKTPVVFLKAPLAFSSFPLSWHSDMHDKSTEANCELCLGLDRKHKGISVVVTGQNNGCGLRWHQESSVRLRFSKLEGGK